MLPIIITISKWDITWWKQAYFGDQVPLHAAYSMTEQHFVHISSVAVMYYKNFFTSDYLQAAQGQRTFYVFDIRKSWALLSIQIYLINMY